MALGTIREFCADSRVVIEAAIEDNNASLLDKARSRRALRKACREARKAAILNIR